jgi:TonB family protein
MFYPGLSWAWDSASEQRSTGLSSYLSSLPLSAVLYSQGWTVGNLVMTDPKFDASGRDCVSGRLNSVLRHFAIILAAGMLFTVSSAKVLGEAHQQTQAKPSVALLVKILTHTGDVDFSAYMHRVSTTVRHNWTTLVPESVKAGETGVVVIHVQVGRDRTFLNDTPKVETSSRRDALDSAAIAAIRASTPFPNFPDDFHGSNIELKMTFLYNVPLRPGIRNPEPAKAPPDAAPQK